VPKGARRSKPFVDHVVSFSIADGKIWFRNFQIKETLIDTLKSASKKQAKPETELSLVEIGPRFVMSPIIIQEGSFSGPVLFENKQYVSPNEARAALKRQGQQRNRERVITRAGREIRKVQNKAPFDPLADEVLFAASDDDDLDI
jgi:ribosome biogenesis protein BRX1